MILLNALIKRLDISCLRGALPALLLGVASIWLTMGPVYQVLAGHLMIDTDYPNAAAAFTLFVRDGWHWPLGANPHFGQVNLFFSDGAPWFALLAKTLHSLTGLDVPFHALVVLNMLLWPLLAWRLACQLSPQPAVRWLVTGLLAFSLIPLVRLIGAQHIALGSYWVVLWAMCCVPCHACGWRRWEFVPALAVAVLSHAYLGAMAALIMLVALLAARRWWAALMVLAWPLALLYAMGALQVESTPMGGAKAYALDLAAFTKSLGWGISGNLYDIHEPTQGDALLYLGTGVWALLLACLLVSAGYRQWVPAPLFSAETMRWRGWLLWLAALLLAGFAMSFDLRVAGHVLLRVDIPGFVRPLYESFRVTGRFATPLAVLLMVWVALWWGAWRHRLPSYLWAAIAALAVFLQAADARHAGKLSPPADWQADAVAQQEALADVLAGEAWSGTVFKSVSLRQLEEHRLLDYLLIKQGADTIRVAHGARLDPDAVARYGGYDLARPGDVVILPEGAEPSLACRRSGSVKHFRVCLL